MSSTQPAIKSVSNILIAGNKLLASLVEHEVQVGIDNRTREYEANALFAGQTSVKEPHYDSGDDSDWEFL